MIKDYRYDTASVHDSRHIDEFTGVVGKIEKGAGMMGLAGRPI